jgi:hypothetical protein
VSAFVKSGADDEAGWVELVHKGAEEADSFRQEYADMNGKVGKLIQLLRRAARFEKLRADVKVFDSSKVAVQSVEEANDKKIIVAVGRSTHRVRCPAYVEHGLDPEVGCHTRE